MRRLLGGLLVLVVPLSACGDAPWNDLEDPGTVQPMETTTIEPGYGDGGAGQQGVGLDEDTDEDGITDEFDVDADNDGIENQFDVDADNDGIEDPLDPDTPP